MFHDVLRPHVIVFYQGLSWQAVIISSFWFHYSWRNDLIPKIHFRILNIYIFPCPVGTIFRTSKYYLFKVPSWIDTTFDEPQNLLNETFWPLFLQEKVLIDKKNKHNFKYTNTYVFNSESKNYQNDMDNDVQLFLLKSWKPIYYSIYFNKK